MEYQDFESAMKALEEIVGKLEAGICLSNRRWLCSRRAFKSASFATPNWTSPSGELKSY